MTTEPIHDDVLGQLTWDKHRNLWTAKFPIRQGQLIEIRLLSNRKLFIKDPEKELKLARKFAPWLRDHDEQARHYATEHLLDLHNEVCNVGTPMTGAAFAKRLRLDSAAIYAEGCTLCYKDKLRAWEHTVCVIVTEDGKFYRADTAPMLVRPEGKIHVEPFPPLVLEDGLWTGKVVLSAWRGFQSRLASYASASSSKKSKETAHLVIAASDQQGKKPPSKEQANGYRYLLDNQTAIRDAILQAVLGDYPDMQKQYGYAQEDAAELMPDIRRPLDLKNLIGLSTVHVMTASKSGTAYVGFEFGCTWDDEHGLGVMTHKNRVVEVGGADTAFLNWIAERDAKRRR